MLLIEELTNSYFVRTQNFLCTLASEVHAVFGGPHGLATHTDIFEVSPTHITEVFVELRCYLPANDNVTPRRTMI